MTRQQEQGNGKAKQLAEPLSPLAVLRIPATRRLWIAQLISTFGDFLALFAVISLLTFRLGATPQQVTALQLAYLLPIAIIWPVLIADSLIGLAVGCIAVIKDTVIQQRTPVALLGRVSSTMLSVIFLAQILGLVSSGFLADHIGVRDVFALFAILPVAVAFLSTFQKKSW